MDKVFPKGINFVENERGTIDMGINIDQFIDFLVSNKKYANSTGWLNITVFRNPNPQLKKGYTHFGQLKTEQKVCSPVSYEEAVNGLGRKY